MGFRYTQADKDIANVQGDLWMFALGFPSQISVLDVNGTRIRATEDGAWLKYGVKPFVYFVASGQSNLNWKGLEEPTPPDPRVARMKNGTLESLSGEIINIASIAAEEYARMHDCAVVFVSENRGATPIEAYLGEHSVDMYAQLKSQTDAVSNLYPCTADALIWFHGGSNESDKSISPNHGYGRKFLRLLDRFQDEPFYDRKTIIVAGEGANSEIIDTFNSVINSLALSDRIANYHICHSRYRQTFDRFHFTEDATISIGKEVANIISSPSISTVNYVIDRPVTIPVSDFEGNLERAIKWVQRFKFSDTGGISILIDQQVELVKAVDCRGIHMENIKIVGAGHEIYCGSNGFLSDKFIHLEDLVLNGNGTARRSGVVCYSGLAIFDQVIVKNFTGQNSRSVNLFPDAVAEGQSFSEINCYRGIQKPRTNFDSAVFL